MMLPQCSLVTNLVNRFLKPGIGLILLGVFVSYSVAETSKQDDRQKWVVRNVYNKFPDEHIRGLAESPDGAIWLGTWGEGLVRYDGRERIKLCQRDGLPNDFIRRVAVAPDGRIWIAGAGGAASLLESATGIQTYTRKEGLLSEDLFGLDIDSKGRVWLAGVGGVCRINPEGSVDHLAVRPPEKKGKKGRSLVVDEARGVVWVGWDSGYVNAFDLHSGKLSVEYPAQLYCASRVISDLELDSYNNLWVACPWDTYRFDGTTVQSIRPGDHEGDWGNSGLAAGPDGTMWLGLQIGLAHYDGESLTFFDPRDGLLQRYVNDVSVSDRGTVWIGTTAGLSFLLPSRFVKTEAPLPHEYRFISVLVDSQDRVWAGGADLSYYAEGEWHSLGLIRKGSHSFYPTTLIETRDGRILSSWNREGIYSWKDGQGEWLPDPPYKDQRFRRLIEGPAGDLYLGTDDEGVYRYTDKGWEILPQPEEGRMESVLALCFDDKGTLWIGTTDNLYTYDQGVTKKVDFPNQGIETLFSEIILGPDQVLYIATEGLGLVTYSDGEWEFFNKENSDLTTSKLRSLGFDGQGRLWLGSRSNGLYRYQDGGWFHYRRNDGLSPCRVNDLSISSEGQVFLATYDAGLLRFTPERSPPQTFIADAPSDVVSDERFIVRLSGMDAWQSTLSRRLQYRWRLDNQPWSPPISESLISTRIRGMGLHTLEVVAVDMDGNIDPTPAEVTINSIPAFWKHPFILVVSGLLILTLFLVISYLVSRSKRLNRSLMATHDHEANLARLVEERTRALKRSEERYRLLAERLEKSNRFKERLIANVSHDFRTPLTSLQGYAQLLASKTPGSLTKDQEEFLQVILNNANRMGLLIQNVAQAIQSDDGEIDLELKPVGLMEITWNSILTHSIRARRQKIELDMMTDGEEEDFYVMGSRTHLERLLDNLISNGIKFTKPGGRVTVRLDNTEDMVILSVSDTGIGIPESEVPRLFERFHQIDNDEVEHMGGLGLGLSICREIAEAHGATIEVESEVGVGSTFRVIWPDVDR